MKTKRTFLLALILTVTTAFSFYRVDLSVAMAAERNEESPAGLKAETEPGEEPTADPKAEPDEEPAADMEAASGEEPTTDPKAAPDEESAADTEAASGEEPTAGAETEPDKEPAADAKAEPVTKEAAVLSEPEESISTGPALIAWLESHKNTGGMVKLTDHVVLDGDYSFYPYGADMPSLFVDTGAYTITVAGAVELTSDSHLAFSGQPDGSAVFYVAEKGLLSVQGVTVESGGYALWQEEGAGLVVTDCRISGDVHYADQPFVVYFRDSICAVVEQGQTLNDALPAQMNCTVNRQGQLSHDEKIPVLWELEGTDRHQTERRRFRLHGSFLHAASSEPAVCTVVYNDYPLTFTDVQASARGCLYTFLGGFTVREEDLPFTVMAEYSFDGENWFLYEEQHATSVNAGFYIACKREQSDAETSSDIYIRLQCDNNGEEYFSNVLRYEADDLDNEEDIGGSRGGGTAIINPPDEPEQGDGDASSEEEPDTKADGDAGSDNSGPGSPTGKSRTEKGKNDADAFHNDAGQPPGTESLNKDTELPDEDAKPLDGIAEQTPYAESTYGIAKQASRAESENESAKQALYADSSNGSADQRLYAEDADKNPLLYAESDGDYRENGASLSRTEKRALRPDRRRVNYMAAAAVFALLSAAAGIAGFYAHSRSGTKR
ncbi:MAG: hypothetical protein K2M20_01095 [Lachnospiraceae bacterium]|nr:hypothetical protein [Lachnospiraceae bacterium]